VQDAVDHLAPGPKENAVLSLVAVHDDASWAAVCGSLLTVPTAVGLTSWRRWREIQPRAGHGYGPGGFDLGPVFWVEPFSGVRVMRLVVACDQWPAAIAGMRRGYVDTPFARCSLTAASWSSTVFLGQGGADDAHGVVSGARRPVEGVVAALDAPDVPATDDTWAWPLPPHLHPGPELGEIAPRRRLLHWPRELLGMDWFGHPDHPPAKVLVVGRTLNDAWITQVRPNYETGDLVTSIAWDEQVIDPLGCTLLVRNEIDGLSALTRHVRISDLPPDMTLEDPEPRHRGWEKRTLDVRLPHGPRRSAWGVCLLSPSGRLLDERPAVARYESVSMSLDVGGKGGPSHGFTVGDRGGTPTAGERDEAVRTALKLETEARAAAARRRTSTSGQMKQYLRWRFVCRAGELLICDPWLLGQDAQAAVAFLREMGRPVRGLAGGIPQGAYEHLDVAVDLEVRQVPGGRQTLHDRVWMVGETGLLVGTSVTDLIRSESGETAGATTITELPHADVAAWREQFEQWWSAAPTRPARSGRRGPERS
jgi:hypothetical protein